MDLKSLNKNESVKSSPDVQQNISPEHVSTPETQVVVEAVEPAVETSSVSEPTTTEEQPAVPEFSVNPPPLQGGGVGVVSPRVDKLESEIEEVLAEDLTDLYLSMPPDKQAEFKIQGEQTRTMIRQLVHHAHKNAKKIFELIRVWLKLIPGVNRFFLEQEAKIKTDKILMVTDEEQRRESKDTL